MAREETSFSMQPPLPPSQQAATHAWSEHLTPEGLRYYYNTATGTSSWDRPHELSQPNTMQLKVVSQDGTEGVLLPPHVPALVYTHGAAHARWRPSSLSAGDRQ